MPKTLARTEYVPKRLGRGVHVRRSTHSYSNGLKINVLNINCSIDQQIIVEVLRMKCITFAPWINSSILQLFVEVLMSFPFGCSADQQK